MVSVIITTRNEEQNIERLLKSIKKQLYKNIEIIVVDNASSDQTVAISKKFTKLVYQKGPERSAQRNFGAKVSKGEYLVFLDADMELTKKVLKDLVATADKQDLKAIVIPEKTSGDGFINKIRKFERQMYLGDLTIEVARFFERHVFDEFGGYDIRLTGPEDYDLPYRVSKKYKIGRSHEYLLHHEENMTLLGLLKKRFYYANKGAYYAKKHPELISKQGLLIARKAYVKNWRKFIKQPFLGFSFLIIKSLESVVAVFGFIKAVGFVEFSKTFVAMFKKYE